MDTSKSTRKKRDPQRRRQIIVEAAAQLLLEEGMEGFSHRRVAALAEVPLGSTTQYFTSLDELREEGLRFLAESNEKDLRQTAELLNEKGANPQVIARFLHDYTCDREQVKADALFYAAASYDEHLHELASRWSQGLEDIFFSTMDASTAQALALFADGVTMRSFLKNEPLDLDFLEKSITILMQNCVPHEKASKA